jgi:hypothetical protein
MKLAVPHWIIIAVTIIGTIAPQVASGFPQTAAVCNIITQLVPVVLGVLGSMSGSVLVKDQLTGVRGLTHPSVPPPMISLPAPPPLPTRIVPPGTP